MHRDTDGPRLVGDRAGDRLTDPPGRIGREFIAAAVLELVDRLHQADVAFLNKIKELQAAVGVFLGNRDHQAQVGLDHFLLGLTGLALALLHLLDDAAIVVDRQAGLAGHGGDIAADLADLGRFILAELGPAHAHVLDPLAPVGIQLGAEIGLEEFGARDAIAVGEAQQTPFQRDQALVDRIQLLDQGLDAVVVQLHRLQAVRDRLGQGLIGLLVLGRQGLTLQPRLDQLVLQATEAAKVVGDRVQDFHDAVAQLGLECRDRHAAAVIKIVLVLFFLGLLFRFFSGAGGLGLAGDRLRRLVVRQAGGVQHAIGGVQVDDLAQQDAVVQQFVAPHHDGFERQGAFAQARDHGVAAGLDALGDGDLALAAQQLDRAHLAQIHAHGVVGAVIGRLGVGLGDRGLGLFGHVGALGGLAVLLGLDDVDAHLRQHGQGVLDLVRRDLFRGQHLVQIFHRHIATRLGLFDKLFDSGIGQIEQGPIIRGVIVLRVRLRTHPVFRLRPAAACGYPALYEQENVRGPVRLLRHLPKGFPT